MTAATPTLRELQLAVWKLLTAPEGARPGLEELARAGELDEETVTAWIAGDERLDSLGRIDVYANMYFFRLRDILAEDFAKTAAILGEARFHNLVTDYLLVHPSSHPSLRWLGRALPAFLGEHAYGRELPWAPQMAALEWARNEAFQSRNTPAVSSVDLAAFPSERWGDLVFSLKPDVSLVTAPFDVVGLFERIDGGAPPSEPERREQHLLVHRPRFAPEVEEIAADEARALETVAAGRTFGEVCGALAPSEELVAEAATRAATLLAAWLERELLSGARLKTT
ncbi:MAG TPA: DNA-binding domain-containing protein [Thermoanaerobaculia bacterium]|nr:DNA-binding domain-containing protein [Thermoanaerobaculia bacterium]